MCQIGCKRNLDTKNNIKYRYKIKKKLNTELKIIKFKYQMLCD